MDFASQGIVLVMSYVRFSDVSFYTSFIKKILIEYLTSSVLGKNSVVNSMLSITYYETLVIGTNRFLIARK